MLDLYFDCARFLFWLCTTYVSKVLKLCFDRARTVFRQCSTFILTVLDLCLACAWPIFRLCSFFCFDWAWTMFRLCSTFVSILFFLFFDCARPMFWLCSTYVSTSLKKNCVCFDCSRLKTASRPQNFIRITARALLSNSKHKTSTSTRVLFDKFLNLLKPKPWMFCVPFKVFGAFSVLKKHEIKPSPHFSYKV